MFSDFAFSSSSEIEVTEYATMPLFPEYVIELSCDDKLSSVKSIIELQVLQLMKTSK